jgi:hypothetical protein
MYFLGIELELAAPPQNLRVHPICCALSLTYSDHRPDSIIWRTAGTTATATINQGMAAHRYSSSAVV